ncbi:MAG TPA: glycosyltransferase family 4 protein [Patescibacteria group bacterium]|nr:glycosyltransferase family 4 protein [Patescibacteria group bacterium]
MKEILVVSIGFSPNLGGIETHFDDLVKALDDRGWKTWVLTYMPITTKVKAKLYEKRGNNIKILRVPWFGNLFYKLVGNPILEFIYLVPGLFFALPFFLLVKGKNIKVIDSHGLIAGFISVFWGKIFSKRIITTTHSIYNFPKRGFYRNFSFWIFNNSNKVLTLSKQSRKEILELGIPENKINVFKYWIDLNKFQEIKNAKKILSWDDNFTVLFVGRLVPEKGIIELLSAASMWNKKIELRLAGGGPLENEIRKMAKKYRNIFYLGAISQHELPKYYSAADLLIVPSVSEEGFGRVILESLACETPVLGSNRGAIPEAMDSTVGKLIDISPDTIKESVEYFYSNPRELNKLSKNARKYALKNFSENNIRQIMDSFDK